MEELTIKIGAKIPKRVRFRKCYKLFINHIHSDGDNFEEKTFYIKEDNIKKIKISKQSFHHLGEFNNVDELEKIV